LFETKNMLWRGWDLPNFLLECSLVLHLLMTNILDDTDLMKLPDSSGITKLGVILAKRHKFLTPGLRPLLVGCKSPKVSTAQYLSTSVLA
jgi:hypothetical protein